MITSDKKNFEETKLVPWDPPGVPKVPISGPNCGIFSKLMGPGPLGSGSHSKTFFSNGRFCALETSQTKKFDAHESKNNVQITDYSSITNSGNYVCLSIETDLGIPVPCAR